VWVRLPPSAPIDGNRIIAYRGASCIAPKDLLPAPVRDCSVSTYRGGFPPRLAQDLFAGLHHDVSRGRNALARIPSSRVRKRQLLAPMDPLRYSTCLLRGESTPRESVSACIC
jgi:hypothetical protein